jgi:hypothetical protein
MGICKFEVQFLRFYKNETSYWNVLKIMIMIFLG